MVSDQKALVKEKMALLLKKMETKENQELVKEWKIATQVIAFYETANLPFSLEELDALLQRSESECPIDEMKRLLRRIY